MTKAELILALKDKNSSFCKTVDVLSDDDFIYAPDEKWSAAQQLDHLCRSTKPLVPATLLPLFVLRLIFGKANRPSLTYNELVEKYRMKLQEGYKATGSYIPPKIYAEQKHFLTKRLTRNISSICKNIDRLSEEELDANILPHPLLGKLTLREMMYFTAYHAAHHEDIVRKMIDTKRYGV